MHTYMHTTVVQGLRRALHTLQHPLREHLFLLQTPERHGQASAEGQGRLKCARDSGTAVAKPEQFEKIPGPI
jgi:hypothetical protein